MNNDIPFGEKVIVFGGDFKQCLPVIKFGDIVDSVECSVKRVSL